MVRHLRQGPSRRREASSTCIPRAAYYALREAFKLPPYAPTTDLAAIHATFNAIEPALLEVTGRANQASLASAFSERVRLNNVQLQFLTFSTGGTNITTPNKQNPQPTLPSYLGFGNMESFFVEVEVQPVKQLTASVSVNVLAGVALNPIDEIFYQSRGRPINVTTRDRREGHAQRPGARAGLRRQASTGTSPGST